MVTVDDDPLEGHDKYGTLRELGRGGMGEVFEALHVRLGTRVVVKLLHADLADKPHLVDRLRLEAQVLARLKHPNIVRVSDFDTTASGRPFFVMEYLHGRSVKQEAHARGGALPVAEAVDIVRQALAGLEAAHDAGIVHRDIKLDNLFLCEPPPRAKTPGVEPDDPRRIVKVLDFGVAKLMQTGEDGPAPLAVPTSTGVVVGTPRFFAPEQARGKALDHRADIYSMGLVLYTLLAGRGPFDHASSVGEMARAHAFDAPAPPSNHATQAVPARLDAIVLQCLRKAPEERFASAKELEGALAQAADFDAKPEEAATTVPDIGPALPQRTAALVAEATTQPLGESPLAPTIGLDDPQSSPAPAAMGSSPPPRSSRPPSAAPAEPEAPAAPTRYPVPLVIGAVVLATAIGAALAAGLVVLL